jgi:hypothetical protein
MQLNIEPRVPDVFAGSIGWCCDDIPGWMRVCVWASEVFGLEDGSRLKVLVDGSDVGHHTLPVRPLCVHHLSNVLREKERQKERHVRRIAVQNAHHTAYFLSLQIVCLEYCQWETVRNIVRDLGVTHHNTFHQRKVERCYCIFLKENCVIPNFIRNVIFHVCDSSRFYSPC